MTHATTGDGDAATAQPCATMATIEIAPASHLANQAHRWMREVELSLGGGDLAAGDLAIGEISPVKVLPCFGLTDMWG
jgi:hypothetical protein